MTSYLLQWFHTYLVHFSALVAMTIMFTVYKNGLPKTNKILEILKSAIIISAIVAIFSSHSHTHYLNFLSGG